MECNENYINVADIVYDSIVDGPGLRITLFVQGCDHHCPGCHNPQLQGIGGYLITPEDLAREITKGCPDPINLTLSGGEPMLQADGLTQLIRRLKEINANINVWCYTGFTWEEIQKNLSMRTLAKMHCDVVVDGKFIQQLRNPRLKFKGSSNQRIINIPATLEAKEVVLHEEDYENRRF